MMVVLVIVAIGSALVVPMVEGGYEAREVRRAARQIASTMHYCRGEAVALGQPQELVIDAIENSIHTTGWGRWAVLTDRAVIEDVRGGQAFGDGVVQILFFPNGSTSGAEVIVAGRRDGRVDRHPGNPGPQREPRQRRGLPHPRPGSPRRAGRGLERQGARLPVRLLAPLPPGRYHLARRRGRQDVHVEEPADGPRK